jgi:regulator of RNase E activity RraA
MKKLVTLSLMLFLVAIPGLLFAQLLYTPEGVRVLQNKPFDDSPEAQEEILSLYESLGVADVCDGMDLVGLQDIGLMDNRIRPYWRDLENFSHQISGFAVTVRFVPSDRRVGENTFDDLEGFMQFRKSQYKRAPHAWLEAIRPGNIAVIASDGTGEASNIGSNNSLGWRKKGVAGVVTNAACRDQDEVISEKMIPVYGLENKALRGARPGRCLLESYNFPVVCGGVTVFPGDLIIGDLDGVIVVPRNKAIEVGQAARAIMIDRQEKRKELLEELRAPE